MFPPLYAWEKAMHVVCNRIGRLWWEEELERRSEDYTFHLTFEPFEKLAFFPGQPNILRVGATRYPTEEEQAALKVQCALSYPGIIRIQVYVK